MKKAGTEATKDSQSETPDSSAFSSFYGNFTHSIDEKGRVSLPAEFRRVLDEAGSPGLVLTNYISEGARCLEGFSIPAWLDFERKLRTKSRFSSKLQKLENFYLSRACQCPIDGSGRILIPSYLRAYAGIEREVSFTASIHGFRVWDRRVWEMVFNSAEQALMEDPEIFAEVDL
ncbi:MAG: division/cell wall cluster transcriptional repressor MraZ [Deltaproteobacteria bacterium]|nr:division/cell wall cluster transcriptional repressor MraZ [Deltaproteobacteria bacterium]